MLKDICKSYENGFHAVNEFNLEIEKGEFIVFVGPSGCGKSTTLRMIAGLEDISDGELWIGDRLVNYLEPKERDLAMVFQSYALYPQMNVYDNIALYGGAGTLVPITGFANSIVSPAMEYKREGFVLGVGVNMFKIAGPVLVFGISASVIYGMIYYFVR